MVDFMQSYRLTGQLFFKLLHSTTQGKPAGTMACLPILKVLKQRGGLSQSAIARELHHSDAAVSRQIGILVEEGLVSTAPDELNRRVIIVELTESGKKTLQKLETAVTDLLSSVLGGMPDERLQQLIDNNNQLQAIITSKLGKEPRAQ